MSEALDFENLLKQALVPVDPPEDLEARLEMTLDQIVEAAADELDAWELSSMKDPRNWVRPAVAVVAGGAAAGGLVVLRAQRKQAKRRTESKNVLDLAERTVKDVVGEARKLARRR